MKTESKSEVLRVAFPYDKPVSFYEPTKIHLAPEYIFLENTFSQLVEMSPRDPKIVGGVASSFSWDGDELHLQIRDSLKTVSGIPITAEDVVFSLKRLLVLSGNTHGNFKDLVCSDTDLTSVEQNCAGIQSRGNTVILKAGKRKTFLLPMLSAIDFAIIPKGSVDPKILQIINYKDTSGPYYVFSDDEKGHATLKLNPNHYKYSKDLPATIELIPSDRNVPNSSLMAFTEGKVDFITTIDIAKPEEVIEFSRTQTDSSLHMTMNIRSFIITFTQRGMNELTKAERFAMGKKMQLLFREAFKDTPGYEKSNQFFPSMSDGALKSSELSALEQPSQSLSPAITKSLKMTVVRIGSKDKYQEIFGKEFPNLEISEGESLPAFLNYKNKKDMPHLFISGPDTGFLEDISLISYTLSAGYFGMTTEERESWLAKYMAISSREERILLLREKHKEALISGGLIPLMVSPYVALARKPWKIELSQYFANNPLWLIKQ